LIACPPNFSLFFECLAAIKLERWGTFIPLLSSPSFPNFSKIETSLVRILWRADYPPSESLPFSFLSFLDLLEQLSPRRAFSDQLSPNCAPPPFNAILIYANPFFSSIIPAPSGVKTQSDVSRSSSLFFDHVSSFSWLVVMFHIPKHDPPSLTGSHSSTLNTIGSFNSFEESSFANYWWYFLFPP